MATTGRVEAKKASIEQTRRKSSSRSGTKTPREEQLKITEAKQLNPQTYTPHIPKLMANHWAEVQHYLESEKLDAKLSGAEAETTLLFEQA